GPRASGTCGTLLNPMAKVGLHQGKDCSSPRGRRLLCILACPPLSLSWFMVAEIAMKSMAHEVVSPITAAVVLKPKFKGVWYGVANFAVLRVSRTRSGQSLQPHS